MTLTSFGTLPDGRKVQRATLTGGGLTAQVLDLGVIVQDLRMEGVDYPLVLGAADPAAYLGPARYFGAIIGRFANRIGNARFSIDGREYHTDPNFLNRHTLHGGIDGADIHLWQITAQDPASVTMTLTLPDGHMGFPGAIAMTAKVALADGAISFTLSAESDAPTPCSLTHHGYFDLDGRGDIRQHRLRIAADTMLPVDEDRIPTGEIASVTGGRFDFRQTRVIGDSGYDCNFCLSERPQPLRPVAWLEGESGVAMRVETTTCGVQLYDGAFINEVPGLDGRRYGPHAGLALETQNWPDAPNHPQFPDAILRPGAVWTETTRYVFSRPA